jgi:hypothetical protein
MYQSQEDKLQARKHLQEAYTFHDSSKHAERVLSPRERRTQAVPVLTIHTDVATMLSQLERSVVLRPPRLVFREVDRELQAAANRVLQIQSGKTISKVCQTAKPPYPLQHLHRVEFMAEREAISPPRGYVVPQVPRPAQFVFPSAVVAGDPAALTQNELNRFRHSIHEADRQRLNETIEDLNRRNRRRPFAIRRQFEDFNRLGMPEAKRRAQRSARLSVLKEKRTETWWDEFIGEFRQDGRSNTELWQLDLLTRVPEFTKESFAWLYREELARRKAGKKFKAMLRRVNELSGALEPYKLRMIFKEVEGQVHINELLSAGNEKGG